MGKPVLILGRVLVIALSSAAFAQGRGSGTGMGGGAKMGAGAQMGNMGGGMGKMGNMGASAGADAGANIGGRSGDNGNFDGQSSTQLSAEGSANTSGPNTADRDFGGGRAEDRGSNSNSSTADTATAQTKAADELGKLNAAHASANGRENAAPSSAAGDIATYQSQMKAALAVRDPTARDAAITSARQQLAANDNKTLTPDAVSRIDSMLGISGASLNLGTQP